MKPSNDLNLRRDEPLELHYSWPLFETAGHFELGAILNCVATESVEPGQVGGLGLYHAGCWECDLADESLIWSGGVYDIFGLPRGAQVTREEAVRAFAELGAKVMIPMHYGTFPLGNEPPGEPVERLLMEADRLGISQQVLIPEAGVGIEW